VAARRLPEIEPGKERGFLFACAQNKAAHFRRRLARKREVSDEVLAERAHPAAAPDLLTEQKRYRELLDHILDAMDEPVRSVFILYSFEEMTMAEVAVLLEIPQGTVASRLRHARQIFKQEILSSRARERQESA
jgi:RNA polymerase sigma-70 factor (ECF subfamily)